MREVLPLATEAGMLYWWWCVYFLIFNTCLLNSLVLIYCHSHYHQIAPESLVAFGRVSIDLFITSSVLLLSSSNSLSCLIYLTGQNGGSATTIGNGSWYVCSNCWNMNNKSSFSSLMHSLLSHNSNAYKACAGKGILGSTAGKSTNFSLILMIAKISF